MRALILGSGVWTSVVLSLAAQPAPDFRQTRWGMTKAEVRAVETAKPTADADNDSYLLYHDSVAHLPCLVGYVFDHDRLVRALYVVDPQPADANSYISDYGLLKRLLTRKYGQPDEDQEVWSNDLYKNHPAEYGKAVGLGFLKRFTDWKTGTTEIDIFLTGKDSKVTLSVDYSAAKRNRPGSF